jgi:hypothetical protein
MSEPYQHNPLAPAHLNKQARDEAIARGEDITQADAQKKLIENQLVKPQVAGRAD